MITLQPINVCSYTISTYFASHMGLMLIYHITAFTLRELPLELYQYRSCCLCSGTALVQVTVISVALLSPMAIWYKIPTHHAYITSSLLCTVLIFLLAKMQECVTYKYGYISENCKSTVLDDSRKKLTLLLSTLYTS